MGDKALFGKKPPKLKRSTIFQTIDHWKIFCTQLMLQPECWDGK